ncbi:MAG: hypothetical protein E7316_05605 [Clostridiales bacterium]|nr:hypothetical protein [Clostridiales bacterium]
MKSFRRLLSLLLVISLLSSCLPALALETPSVSMQVTPSQETLGVGDHLTVTLQGVHTVDHALMVVLPDSTQAFYYSFPATVPLMAAGTYVLIGYGVNTTDTTDPEFLRCMSAPATFTVTGTSSQLAECSMAVDVMHKNAWQSLNGSRLDAGGLRLRVHTTADAQLTEEAELSLTLYDDRGRGYTLIRGALTDLALRLDESSYQLEISDHNLAEQLLRQEYTEQAFTLEASLTQSSVPLAQTSSSFRLNSYTNEMRYINQFYDEDFTLGATEAGRKLLTWLDMSERDVTTRTNSGYLMLDQEYLHQQSVGYSLGYGYVYSANALLDTISNLGLNLVEDAIENEICKAKFKEAGKSAKVYYQMLVDIYADYANKIIEKSMLLDQAILDLDEILGKPLTLVDEEANLAMSVVQTPAKDIACFKPQTFQGEIVTYRLVDMQLQAVPAANQQGTRTVVSFMVSGPEGSGMVMEMSPYQLLAPTREGIAVRVDTTALIDKYDFDLETEYIAPASWLTSAADADLCPVAYSAQWTACDVETLKSSRSFDKLDVDVKSRLKELGECLEDALTYTSLGLSSVTYLTSLSETSAQQKALFKLLTEMTDEYLLLLDSWEQTALASDSKGKEDVVDAIRALKQDVRSTESELAASIAKFHNTFILTSDGFSGLVVDSLSLIAEKLGLDKLVKQKLAVGAQSLANKLGGKMPQHLAALKLPKGGMFVINVGNIVLSMMSAKYLSFHENVKAVYALKETLTASVKKQLNAYAIDPTHEKAVTLIAALETLKTTKQIGEGLIEAYYLDDLYSDLDMDSMPDVRTVIWNEILLLRGLDQLNISASCYPFTAVYEDVDVEIQPQFQHLYKPGQKTYPHTVFHGWYALSSKKPVIHNGVTLQPLPEKFQNVHSSYQTMLHKLNLRRSGIYVIIPPAISPLQENAWWSGQSLPVEDINRVYRDPMYQYRADNGLTVILSNTEYHAATNASDEINRILTTYSDDTSQIKWYDFTQRSEQQHQQRILWTKITHRYIESLKMYDSSTSY